MSYMRDTRLSGKRRKDYASNKNTYAELVNKFSIYPKLIYNLVFIAKAKLEIVGSRLYIRKKQDVFYIDFNLDDVKLFHNNYCQTAVTIISQTTLAVFMSIRL